MSKVMGSPTVTPINIKNLTVDVSKIQNLQKYYGDITVEPTPEESFIFSVDENMGFAYIQVCPSVEKLVIPYEYNGYPVYYVEGCNNSNTVREIIMPNTIRLIGPEAFSYLSNLSYINIPEGVEIIGEHAFQSSGLKSITIPKSVTEIGIDAFASCDNLTDVHYEGTQEEWKLIMVSSGNDLLLNANIQCEYAGESVGGGSAQWVEIANITTTEEVNSIICADENSFADIGKVGDFNIQITIPKHDTKVSGHLLININNRSAARVSDFDTGYLYVCKNQFNSINIPNVSRINMCQVKFSANEASDLNLTTTSAIISSPISSISISLATATSMLPIGTKIKLVGRVG